MSEKNFLYEAFLQAGEKLVNDALKRSRDDLNSALRMAFPRYVDSTAIVINDVKALPEPEESEQ